MKYNTHHIRNSFIDSVTLKPDGISANCLPDNSFEIIIAILAEQFQLKAFRLREHSFHDNAHRLAPSNGSVDHT